ncbi:MAG: EAL domain-containing protein [Pseudorhodoplanes sp.]
MTSIRNKTFAAILGALLAGLPMLALHAWLDELALRQGQGEAETVARRTISLAETRIGRAVATLDDLADLGVASCRADHVQALKRSNFATGPVKEFSLVAPDGSTLCSDMESTVSDRTLIAAQKLAARSDLMLELVRIGDRGERFVRLRRETPGGPNGIAALIPIELLIPQSTMQGAPANANMRMTLGDGSVVGGRTASAEGRAGDKFVSTQYSPRYGLTVTVSMPLSSVAANRGELRALGLVVSAGLIVAIGALLAATRWRRHDNPVEEIARAIEAREFIPYYQPVIDISTGRVAAAEVLMRWRKPDGTIVPPAKFIPLAESSGLIVAMTRSIMIAVREEIGADYAKRPHLRIGFNLSARHFDDEQIVADVRRIFQNSPVQMQQIVLEVTERQPLENLTAARRIVAALQGLGVRVAMDDVGAGHSGLSYMLKLGVDMIKIDKVFIDALGRDSNSTTIIGTLVDLARNMRMDVVAEGVENFEQVVALRDHGIRLAQGYVFAPPLPGPSYLRLLQAADAKPGSKPARADSPAPRRLAAVAG